MQIKLKITSRIWLGPFGSVVGVRLQCVWFAWRGSHRAGCFWHLARTGFGSWSEITFSCDSFCLLLKFNHITYLQAFLSWVFFFFLTSSFFIVQGFVKRWFKVSFKPSVFTAGGRAMTECFSKFKMWACRRKEEEVQLTEKCWFWKTCVCMHTCMRVCIRACVWSTRLLKTEWRSVDPSVEMTGVLSGEVVDFHHL